MNRTKESFTAPIRLTKQLAIANNVNLLTIHIDISAIYFLAGCYIRIFYFYVTILLEYSIIV